MTTKPSTCSLATELSHIARTFEASIRTVNLPVQRGSTVLFDSIADAFAAGERWQPSKVEAMRQGLR
jgi:hypothetical protein